MDAFLQNGKGKIAPVGSFCKVFLLIFPAAINSSVTAQIVSHRWKLITIKTVTISIPYLQSFPVGIFSSHSTKLFALLKAAAVTLQVGMADLLLHIAYDVLCGTL